MDLNLAGRTVLVTGGSKGIGFACAAAFRRGGGTRGDLLAQSRHSCRREQGAQEKGHEVVTLAADLVDPKSAPELVAQVERRLGPVEVTRSIAPAQAKRYACRSRHAGLAQRHDRSTSPTCMRCKAVLPGMVGRKRGAIVNIVGQGGKVASKPPTGGSANAALMLVSVGLATLMGAREFA